MEVTKLEILPSTDPQFYVDQAHIDLRGEVEVKGTIEYIPQGFEHVDQQVQLTIDPNAVFPRMKVSDDPNLKLYEKINLTFDDPEVLKQFGNQPKKGKATLLLREYHIRFPEVEEQDGAVVKRVLSMNVENR